MTFFCKICYNDTNDIGWSKYLWQYLSLMVKTVGPSGFIHWAGLVLIVEIDNNWADRLFYYFAIRIAPSIQYKNRKLCICVSVMAERDVKRHLISIKLNRHISVLSLCLRPANETVLRNSVSHWLGASLESPLYITTLFICILMFNIYNPCADLKCADIS